MYYWLMPGSSFFCFSRLLIMIYCIFFSEQISVKETIPPIYLNRKNPSFFRFMETNCYVWVCLDIAYFAKNWKLKILQQNNFKTQVQGYDMTRQIAPKIILKYYSRTWHAKHITTVRLSSFKMHLSSFTCTVPWVPLFKRQTKNVQ